MPTVQESGFCRPRQWLGEFVRFCQGTSVPSSTAFGLGSCCWLELLKVWGLSVALCIGLLALPATAANFGKGYGEVSVDAVAVDGLGNAYIAGSFSGVTADIGGVTLVKIGSSDAFVAKLDAAGATVWAKNFGGMMAVSMASTYGQSLAVDGVRQRLSGWVLCEWQSDHAGADPDWHPGCVCAQAQSVGRPAVGEELRW